MIQINWGSDSMAVIHAKSLLNTREIIRNLERKDPRVWASKIAELRRTERAQEHRCAMLDAMYGGNI